VVEFEIYELRVARDNEDARVAAYVYSDLAGAPAGLSSTVEGAVPYFNERFFAIVSTLTDMLSFNVFLSSSLSKDKHVGTAEFNLGDLERFPCNRNLYGTVLTC
jgi:Ca2+-dependent lipid-binding protein